LAEAAKTGVRVIFPLVNVWTDLGGMQWWVDLVRGCTILIMVLHSCHAPAVLLKVVTLAALVQPCMLCL